MTGGQPRVLVAGWIGSTNLGDELAFAGLRRLLAAHGAHVTAISTAPERTRAIHDVEAVDHRDVRGVWRAVGDADAVVFGGGGIVQDVTSPANLPYHLSRVALARLRRTPVAGIGLGVGGLDTRLGRRLTRMALRRVVGVTVRDEASRDLLAEVGVPGAQVAADLALALEPPVAVPSTGRLVVSLRPWTEQRSSRPASAQGDTTPQEHVDALARALDEVVAATGLSVRFVAFQSDRDAAFHARVAARMTHPSEGTSPDLGDVLDEFAAADAVVAMRYHAAVAATLAGCPVVLVSYALKCDALARELGSGTRRLGWRPDELARIPDALTEVLAQQDAVVAAREDLRARQAVNARMLDRLLTLAGPSSRAG